jgi:integrase
VNGLRELDGIEKKRLLNLASGLDRIILHLLFETNLDIDHLINLHVSDLDLKRGQLRVDKDKRIVLSDEAILEIRDYLKSRPGQSYLLVGRCGKPVTSKWKRCIFENLLLKARQKK